MDEFVRSSSRENPVDETDGGTATRVEGDSATSPLFDRGSAEEMQSTLDHDKETRGRLHNQDDTRVRLTIDVTPQLYGVVSSIAAATGSTKSEAIRKAIALMDVAVEARERGERIFVSKTVPPGSSREIIGL